MNNALIAKENQSTDFIELFFDLVFVFAITKITHFTAHHLDVRHVLQSVFIFWLIWWGWSQITWTLNAANTKHIEIRIGTLIATAFAFVMAANTDHAFDSEVLWFTIPYIIVKLLGLGIYFRVTPPREAQRSALVKLTLVSIIPLVAVMVGAFSDPSVRIWWWAGSMLFDLVSAFFVGRERGWKIHTGHFAERHGLIVIIALGESLIVSASAVGESQRSTDLMITGGLAVLVTFLLWWTYFSWINDFLEWHLKDKTGAARARLGMNIYSFLHFPLIYGIIGMAVGFQVILTHPSALLTFPVAMALGGGVLLFTGSTAAAVWISGRHPLGPRYLILGASIIIYAFFIGHHPAHALGLIALSLVLIDIIEWKMCRIPH
jgi:low temperature requirement protein LtrA